MVGIDFKHKFFKMKSDKKCLWFVYLFIYIFFGFWWRYLCTLLNVCIHFSLFSVNNMFSYTMYNMFFLRFSLFAKYHTFYALLVVNHRNECRSSFYTSHPSYFPLFYDSYNLKLFAESLNIHRYLCNRFLFSVNLIVSTYNILKSIVYLHKILTINL